jgi:hypothetical protein
VIVRRSWSHLSVAVLAAVAAWACSSSTGPGGPTAAQSAEYSDSIYSALLAQGGDTGVNAIFANDIAALIEPAPAYGGAATPFTMMTASGPQTWEAATVASAVGSDTFFVTTAYPANSNLETMWVTEAYYDSTNDIGTYTFLLYDSAGTVGFVEPPTSSVSTTLQSVGRVCHQEAGLAADTVLDRIFAGATSCNLITVTFSATGQVTWPGLPTAEASLSATNVTLHGVLFGGTFYEPDQAPRTPTIANARAWLVDSIVRARSRASRRGGGRARGSMGL